MGVGGGVGYRFKWEWVEDVGYRFRWEWVGVLGLDGNGCRILAIDFLMECVGGVGYRFRWEWEEDFGIDLDGSGWGSWV